MSEGHILHGTRDEVHVLRFVGEVRYPLTPAAERYLDKLFARSVPRAVVVDLSETELIDSTNLGLLARIANRMRAAERPPVTIISGRADIDETLHSVGFEQVFDIVSQADASTADEHPLPVGVEGRESVARTVLATHRALMELNARNRDQFRDVVAALEREMGDPTPG